MNRKICAVTAIGAWLFISTAAEARPVIILVKVSGSLQTMANVSKVRGIYRGSSGSDLVRGKVNATSLGTGPIGKYKSTLKSDVRSSAGVANYVEKGAAKISRRSIKLPFGTFKLSKPINPSKRGRQKISGRGMALVEVP